MTYELETYISLFDIDVSKLTSKIECSDILVTRLIEMLSINDYSRFVKLKMYILNQRYSVSFTGIYTHISMSEIHVYNKLIILINSIDTYFFNKNVSNNLDAYVYNTLYFPNIGIFLDAIDRFTYYESEINTALSDYYKYKPVDESNVTDKNLIPTIVEIYTNILNDYNRAQNDNHEYNIRKFNLYKNYSVTNVSTTLFLYYCNLIEGAVTAISDNLSDSYNNVIISAIKYKLPEGHLYKMTEEIDESWKSPLDVIVSNVNETINNYFNAKSIKDSFNWLINDYFARIEYELSITNNPNISDNTYVFQVIKKTLSTAMNLGRYFNTVTSGTVSASFDILVLANYYKYNLLEVRWNDAHRQYRLFELRLEKFLKGLEVSDIGFINELNKYNGILSNILEKKTSHDKAVLHVRQFSDFILHLENSLNIDLYTPDIISTYEQLVLECKTKYNQCLLYINEHMLKTGLSCLLKYMKYVPHLCHK